MKKLFTLMTVALFALSMNAKQVVFDFSNATAYGYQNPAAGANTQVNSGDTLKQEGVAMVITFASGNGFRFFGHSTTGAVNLRGYIGAKFDIIAPAGSKIYSAEISGSNANSQYVSGDLKDGSWTNAAGADTLHSEVIKSTLQINTLTLIIAAEGETPELEKFDTLTVAQAKAICDTLKDNGVSAKKYYVEGYAVNVQPYSTQHNNQIFFMVDDVNAPDSLFEAYAAYPSKNDSVYPVLAGDKVRAFGTLKKYVGSAFTQLELVNPTVEFITEVPGDRSIVIPIPDTLTVAEAIVIGTALADNKTTDVEYVVKGYARSPKGPNEGYTDQTWYMADEPGAYGEFTAYQCQPDTKVMENDFMLVRGKIYKYVTDKGTTIEISKGTAVHGVAPAIDTVKVDVAGAMTAGEALEDNTTTEEFYYVIGYVVKPKELEEGDTEQDFYMADEKDATFGAFKCYKAKIAYPGVAAGNKVGVFGKIKKSVYNEKTTIQMEYASVTVIEGQGIENVVLTEKAQKVMVDGVVYIIRDNKMYDVMGTQIR